MNDRAAGASSLDGLFSHRLKRLRLAMVRPFIPPGARILDVGCDDAALLDGLPPFAAYHGLDMRVEVVTRNQAEIRRPGVTFSSGRLDEFHWDGPPFDRVVLAAVIEHLEDFPAPLAQLAALTAEGGLLLITTPAPLAHWVLIAGAAVRLFARDSLQEHKRYFRRSDFSGLPGWQLVRYRRFELGLNQLAVLRRQAVSD